MKKKYWISVVAIGLVLLLLFLNLVPYHPFDEKDDIVIDSVSQNFDGALYQVDITDQIDVEKLESYLLLMKTKRLREHSVRHVAADVTYYIDGICNGNPMHIIVGPADENWVYESADRGGYRIQNPEVWLQLIEGLKDKETA